MVGGRTNGFEKHLPFMDGSQSVSIGNRSLKRMQIVKIPTTNYNLWFSEVFFGHPGRLFWSILWPIAWSIWGPFNWLQAASQMWPSPHTSAQD